VQKAQGRGHRVEEVLARIHRGAYECSTRNKVWPDCSWILKALIRGVDGHDDDGTYAGRSRYTTWVPRSRWRRRVLELFERESVKDIFVLDTLARDRVVGMDGEGEA
jgi:hypothetical protein